MYPWAVYCEGPPSFIRCIPEQFTVKAHPALFEGEGEGSEPKIEALYIPVYNWHTHSKGTSIMFNKRQLTNIFGPSE